MDWNFFSLLIPGGILRSDVSQARSRHACTPSHTGTMTTGVTSYTPFRMPLWIQNEQDASYNKLTPIKKSVWFCYYRDSKPFAGFPPFPTVCRLHAQE
jgi:hypothetical protein